MIAQTKRATRANATPDGNSPILLSRAKYAKYSANNGVESGDLQGNCHIVPVK